ncbi:MAG: triose-phosphate isomerase [Thermomicrobiales bacterium]|nr:triose-phosphate isomerase [Thermomicrobiales bacterium]
MNTTRNDALALASALTDADLPQNVDVAVFPPSIWIEAVRRALGQDIHLGAQDCSAEVKGAFTGQVAAVQLRELCDMVIVGHSERRRDAYESDELVGRKAAAALAAGLTPIACVGESLEVREAGEAENVVGSQVDAIVQAIGDVPASEFVLAYEPIWAIGTGRSASSEDAQSMCAFIRSRIGAGGPDVRILYGGSVVPDNAGAYLAQADVDGLLVGGASLKADQFLAIVAAC